MQKKRPAGTDHLYLQIADGLEKMIAGDILKIGDKLPSVRMLSEEYGISMGTAFRAYYHLEGKGLIEARPKSGYYVRFSFRRMPGLPGNTEPEPVANEVSIKDMIAAVYKNISAQDLVNFSIAAPPLSLLPAARLNKSLIHALRSSSHHGIQYEHSQGNPQLEGPARAPRLSLGRKICGGRRGRDGRLYGSGSHVSESRDQTRRYRGHREPYLFRHLPGD
ncbi:GntR family transcriptional regulator [Puia sp. P3]|uniref:GntR family transcriptional regulator n=1 Tax=Puia sp. P3 TaxID=3423952 RepID=UPI003D67733C